MEGCSSVGNDSGKSVESEGNLSVGSPDQDESPILSRDTTSFSSDGDHLHLNGENNDLNDHTITFNTSRDTLQPNVGSDDVPNQSLSFSSDGDNLHSNSDSSLTNQPITYDTVFDETGRSEIDKAKSNIYKKNCDLKIKTEFDSNLSFGDLNRGHGVHPNFHGFGYSDHFGPTNNLNGDFQKSVRNNAQKVLFNATQFAHGCQSGNESFKTDVHHHIINKSGTDVQFRCNMCGKCFTHSCKLQTHQRYHNGEKPFKCGECGKCFTQRAGLMQHHRLHTGEKPFKCQECGKSFTQLAGVVQHHRTHSGEKPFGCTECGKSFSQRAGLLQHERLHTGEKPFNCLECGKCFTQLAGLNQHMRTHSGEKPFKCHVCGKCYTQHAGLMAHMKSHTGESPSLHSPTFSEEHQINSNSDTPSVSSNPSREDLISSGKSTQSENFYSASNAISVPNYSQHQSMKMCSDDISAPSHLSNLLPNMQFVHGNMFTSSVSAQSLSHNKHKMLDDGLSPPYDRHSSVTSPSSGSSKSQKKSKIDKPFKCNICSKAYTQFAGLMIHQASHQPEQNSISSSISAAVENIFMSPSQADGSVSGIGTSTAGLPFIPPSLYTPGNLLQKVPSTSKNQQGNTSHESAQGLSQHAMNMTNSLMNAMP